MNLRKLILTFFILFGIISSGYAQKKHPKVESETEKEKNLLDKKTHPNSQIIEFVFKDGVSAHMVKRDETWYNYNIRGEKKEKPFKSKEEGLQKIWSDAVKSEAIGGAIAGSAIKSKKKRYGPEGKLGTDKNGKEYKVVNGSKVLTRKSYLPTRSTN